MTVSLLDESFGVLFVRGLTAGRSAFADAVTTITSVPDVVNRPEETVRATVGRLARV
jgi:hypothetical protein